MFHKVFSHVMISVLMTSCVSQKNIFAGESNNSGTASAFIAALPAETTRPWEAPQARSNVTIPSVPERIMGTGKTNKTELAYFLRKMNPFIEESFAMHFAAMYIEEAAAEGVNHDVAFAQMCLETGYLSFGGLVKSEMHNYCGLGSTGGSRGASFPSPRIGIRAQIQHLKVYATPAPLKHKTVDPRRHLVRPGSAVTISQLTGLWAEDKEYGKKIKEILERLYITSFGL